MALLADKSADVNSNLVTGQNTQSLTFVMPGNIAMKVLSVVATINNGSAVAVKPELTIKDQSGVVIGTKKQTSSIPAGDTGTATYALRLADSVGAGIQYDTLNVGGWLSVETTTTDPSAFGGGVSFVVDAGDFNVVALAGQVYIDGSSVSIFSEDSDMVIDSHQDIQMFARGGGANIWDITGSLAIQTGAGFDIALTAGQFLTVRDHLGNAIFRVDEDGDLHGLTGKALVFDL